MTEILFPGATYSNLAKELAGEIESCAVAFATPTNSDGRNRLLIRDIRLAPKEAYTKRTRVAAQLDSSFIGRLAKQARNEKKSMVFIHSHVSGPASFSQTDDRGERQLKTFLARQGNSEHAALIISGSSCSARKLGSDDAIDVYEVGRNFRRVSVRSNHAGEAQKIFDRQVRAFGSEGQARLHEVRVALVGLGGTGSVVAQQLAYLGVENFLLIDPDSIEVTNLNRVVGASMGDLGLSKVSVTARQILAVRPTARIEVLQENIIQASAANKLKSVDAIFCCTDSHGSRAILNQIAYQYYIPCLDMGIGIEAKAGEVTHVTGRVQMLSPGLSCLTCAGLLDADAVRRDLMSEQELAHDAYFFGQGVPQPAVVSLNSTVSSLAVTMWLSAIVGIPSEPRMLLYDGARGKVRPATQTPVVNCVTCSLTGSLGRADEWPLPVRQS